MMSSIMPSALLSDLLLGFTSELNKVNNTRVTGLSLDSRKIEADWLFIALATDCEQRSLYIASALDSGSTAVLYDAEHPLSSEEQACLLQHSVSAYSVVNVSEMVSEIAARFYHHPSKEMTVLAVTGTNGKTSVSQFIAQALESQSIACGVIGTLGVGRISNLVTTNMTTPDPITVQATLAQFRDQGIEYVAIEASSHALVQGRLKAVEIDVAILTNLSRDHLDYHGDMATYSAAKFSLFEFASLSAVVLNVADTFGRTIFSNLSTRSELSFVNYDANGDVPAALVARNSKTNLTGISFDVEFNEHQATVNSSLLARFNIDNLLASIAGLLATGFEFETVIKAINQCHAVDGRMQTYTADGAPLVVIDFAHTSDALAHALQALHAHKTATSKVWCVFGCGGDRDTGKRPLMGHVAELNADYIVLTADNPRSEDNASIIKQILAGMAHPEKAYIEPARDQAICYAIEHATRDDIVLIAGKGHEQYQDIAGVKRPFSDVKVVLSALHAANDLWSARGDAVL
jgi:UDP-N-acetylmuramoyl-L-alanyl-D-glutamate--2,6-diaminopimelate ligase